MLQQYDKFYSSLEISAISFDFLTFNTVEFFDDTFDDVDDEESDDDDDPDDADDDDFFFKVFLVDTLGSLQSSFVQ